MRAKTRIVWYGTLLSSCLKAATTRVRSLLSAHSASRAACSFARRSCAMAAWLLRTQRLSSALHFSRCRGSSKRGYGGSGKIKKEKEEEEVEEKKEEKEEEEAETEKKDEEENKEEIVEIVVKL